MEQRRLADARLPDDGDAVAAMQLQVDAVQDLDAALGQQAANDLLRDRFRSVANVAMTLTPALPEWIRNLGLSPMSLGLDLRGGVYFLLEVDMETAEWTRMAEVISSVNPADVDTDYLLAMEALKKP